MIIKLNYKQIKTYNKINQQLNRSIHKYNETDEISEITEINM